MKSAPESSGIFSKAAQSSTGPREAVRFSLVAAGLCGIANRQLEPPCRRFLFAFALPLAATKCSGLLFNFKSINGCDQTSIQALAYEVQFALSPAREAERPIRDQSWQTMRLTGNSSCDTTPDKFGVVNLVAQHNKAADQKFSGHGHFGFRFAVTMKQAEIEALQFRITLAGGLRGLDQQEPQDARASFADPEIAFLFSG